jgi:hypothetical protein
MSFSLRNTALAFQRFMDDILQGLNFCFAYLDDILSFSQSLKEHTRHLQQASDVWDPNKPGEASPLSIRSHLSRLQGVRQGFLAAERTSSSSTGLPPPKTTSQLHRFLGMLTF